IDEVKAADPFPRDGRYEKKLRGLRDQLAGGEPQRVRWLDKAIEGFGRRDRDGALEGLTDLDQKLAALEESLEPAEGGEGVLRRSRQQIKELLPGAEDGKDATKAKPPRDKEREKEKVRRDDPDDDGPRRGAGGGGGGAVAPQAGGGGF